MMRTTTMSQSCLFNLLHCGSPLLCLLPWRLLSQAQSSPLEVPSEHPRPVKGPDAPVLRNMVLPAAS